MGRCFLWLYFLNGGFMRYFLLLCLLIVVNGSCTEEYTFELDNLNHKIIALGHGGMGRLNKYPINTYESIKKCLTVGADGTELDVQMSKDGWLFAFHDEDMEEATNLSGRLNMHNYKKIEIASYDKLPNGEFYIYTVDEIFEHIPEIEKYHFSFDCKLFPATDDSVAYFDLFAKNLIETINHFGIKEKSYVESTSIDFLTRIQQLDPSVHTFFYTKNYNHAISVADKLNLKGITIEYDKITKEEIALLHKRNLMVAIFGAWNKNGNIELAGLNPDIIQTDDVPSLVRILR